MLRKRLTVGFFVVLLGFFSGTVISLGAGETYEAESSLSLTVRKLTATEAHEALRLALMTSHWESRASVYVSAVEGCLIPPQDLEYLVSLSGRFPSSIREQERFSFVMTEVSKLGAVEMSVFSRTREGSQASTREALIDLAYLVSQVCDSNGSLLRNEIMSVSAPPEPGGAQGIEYLRNFNTQAWQVLESDVPSAERLEGLSDLGGISSMLSREAGLSVESRNAGSYVEFIISGQDLPPSLVTRLQDDLLEAFSGPTLGGAERMSPYYLVGSSGIIAEPGNMAAYQLFGVVAAVLILATFRALVDGKSAPSSVSGISGKAS